MTSVHKKSIKIAADAAIKAHRTQFRRDGKTPYIVHPERVAGQVKFFGGNHIGIIAAWLHDVIEDCPHGDNIVLDTLQKIELSQKEKDEIFTIVSALTKNDAIKGKSEKLADTLNRINQAPSQAILIKLCDRIDNFNDAKDQDQVFLSIYLRCTDQLINTLSASAMKHGYIRALETLKAIRRTYPG
jgi:(p)ppGpp synthase/HD superfamily hydrolase